MAFRNLFRYFFTTPPRPPKDDLVLTNIARNSNIVLKKKVGTTLITRGIHLDHHLRRKSAKDDYGKKRNRKGEEEEFKLEHLAEHPIYPQSRHWFKTRPPAKKPKVKITCCVGNKFGRPEVFCKPKGED